MTDEQEPKPTFIVDFKEVPTTDGSGGTDIEMVAYEEHEVVLASYEIETEGRPGDIFVRTQPGKFSGTEVVFKRRTELTGREAELAQYVYTKTKDWVW